MTDATRRAATWRIVSRNSSSICSPTAPVATTSWLTRFDCCKASAAYILIHHLREFDLKQTALCSAQVETVRRKLFKVAARITTSVRRVLLHLSSSHPYPRLFADLVARLVPT